MSNLCACMRVCLGIPGWLCVSTCHKVKQPEVWSNFLGVMEVITSLAHCSDWSLLRTMDQSDFVWGRSVEAGSVIRWDWGRKMCSIKHLPATLCRSRECEFFWAAPCMNAVNQRHTCSSYCVHARMSACAYTRILETQILWNLFFIAKLKYGLNWIRLKKRAVFQTISHWNDVLLPEAIFF